MGHHHEHGKANLWTKWNGLGEFLVDLASTVTFWAAVIDFTVLEKDEDSLGFSSQAIFWASMIGAFSAVGSTYCHWILKKQTQREDSLEEETELTPQTLSPGKVKLGYQSVASQEGVALLSQALSPGKVQEGYQSVPSEGGVNSAPQAKDASALKCYQKIALLGDGLGHVSDVASPLNLYARILGAGALFGWQQGLLTVGLLGLGILGSVADIRTCMVSLRAENAGKVADKSVTEAADKWTKFSALMEFFVEFASNSSLVAAVLSYGLSSSQSDELGYSEKGLILGGIWGLLTAASGTYCHYLLHEQTQSSQTIKDNIGVVHLPAPQKVVLGLDYFGHVGDVIAPILLLLKVIELEKLSVPSQIAVTAGLGIFALGASVGDYHTCSKVLKKAQLSRLSSARPAQTFPEV